MIKSIRRRIDGDEVMLRDGAQVTQVHRDSKGDIWVHADVDLKQPALTVKVRFTRWQGHRPRLAAPRGFVFADDVPAQDQGQDAGTASVFVGAVPEPVSAIPLVRRHLQRAFLGEGVPA